MSVQTEISRLQAAKSALRSAIQAKGVTVPASGTLDGYAALVDQISQGTPVETCTLNISNQGTGMPSVQAFLYLVDAEGNFMNGTSLLASRQATYTMQKKSFLYVDTAGRGQCTVVSGEVTTILEDAIFMIGGDAEIVITK